LIVCQLCNKSTLQLVSLQAHLLDRFACVLSGPEIVGPTSSSLRMETRRSRWLFDLQQTAWIQRLQRQVESSTADDLVPVYCPRAIREPPVWARSQVGMLTPSRFHPSATGSPPHRRRRRVASLMDQYQAAPSGRSDNRSSSQWPRRGLGFDLGFLLGRRPRPGGEKLDPANWLRCVLSPPPTAEAEADGKAVGSSEEQEEVGVEEADHLVVTVNGLYGRFVFGGFACGYVLLC
jgi:hypothetical protein